MYENLDKSELREAYGSSEDKYTVQTCVLCILYEANDLAYWLVNDRAYWLVNDLAYWLCRLARSQHTVSLSGTMKSGKSFGSVGV